MKILVPIKRVVDANVKIRINQDKMDIDKLNLKMVINPFCEIAIEEAVRLKEKQVATEIVAVTIGNQLCQEQLRTAMALGVDRGIHIEADDNLPSISIAKILHAVQKQENAHLIILGKQSIDGDNNQTGQMLAALLDMPQATFISNLQISNNQLHATREIDIGMQDISMPLPAVVTTDLRLNTPRYAKLPDIMKAKRKQLDTFSLQELGVYLKEHQQILQIETPKKRDSGQMVSSVSELITKLKEEAKVM